MATPLLEVTDLGKGFHGAKALDAVDLTVQAGDIQALKGENGARKSTLIKVLTGGLSPRRRRNAVGGPNHCAEIAARGGSARHKRCIVKYQEGNLIPHFSVAENICLSREQCGACGPCVYTKKLGAVAVTVGDLGNPFVIQMRVDRKPRPGSTIRLSNSWPNQAITTLTIRPTSVVSNK